MDINEFPSKLLENAVDEFSKLPGVGKKTALRFVLHLLNKEESAVSNFGNSIIDLKKNVQNCSICNNISDNDICNICLDNSRDKSLVCVVESIRDIMSIESTQQYFGVYHVLGGIISPMEGIGPNDLNFNSLEQRMKNGNITEVIFALSTTMEGDTTNFYLFKKLKKYNIKITTLARGISFGDEIEYSDELTLGRSIVNRYSFEQTFQNT